MSFTQCKNDFEKHDDIHKLWKNYKNEHNLLFHEDEEHVRLSIFRNHHHMIKAHNSNPNKKFKMKLNKFAHLYDSEFKDIYLKQIRKSEKEKKLCLNCKKYKPVGVNWKNLGFVSPVKNQEHCGSCWAFAAIGAVESQYAILFKKNISLSEQELVDCSTSFGNHGCNGGMYGLAFEYMMKYGISNSSDYPYFGKDMKCNKPPGRAVTLSGYHEMILDEDKLISAIETVGPVAVAIDAGSKEFRFYHRGIFPSKYCGNTLNHAVLVVATDVSTSNHYYTLKNSWGTSWGNSGFFQLAMDENACGIAIVPAYPVIFLSKDIK